MKHSPPRKCADFFLVSWERENLKNHSKKGKQMIMQNAISQDKVAALSAPFDRRGAWTHINWRKCQYSVRRLQMRIVLAMQQGRWGRVKSLQRLLTNSYSAKALAVKHVTENTGKRTPGVDGQIWSSVESKYCAISSLKTRGYRPYPLKRVWIEKSNGSKRPLGIPTMKDRAMQALYAFALEPIAETTGDANSYGFRKRRSTADAIGQSFIALARKDSSEWILEADIKSCFDQISHEWLLKNIPTEKGILKKWLKAKILDGDKILDNVSGTPQGGIISPILANMTLDGLERLLKLKFRKTAYKGKPLRYGVNMIRYADDLIVTGKTKEILQDKVLPIIITFLQERGLSLSISKTRITHIHDGIDFLGQTLRKYEGKLLITPSKQSLKAIVAEVGRVIKLNYASKQEDLIAILNPKLRGWTNYHAHVVSSKAFSRLRFEVWRKLWRWCCRRHPNKGKRWIKQRYFHGWKGKDWVFAVASKTSTGVKAIESILLDPTRTKIRRHCKIKSMANPYDPNWNEYFKRRKFEKKTVGSS